MLDSIHIGVSGLLAYQQGLRVIANNTTNLNTPGYKSSTLQFADLFYAQGGNGGAVQLGHGVDTVATHIDWRQGDFRQTGNDFDLALDGEGMFTLRDGQGETRYTRAGQFHFDANGVLVNVEGSQVLGTTGKGAAGAISLAGLRSTGGEATQVVRFTGNLSSTSSSQTVGSVKTFDAAGGAHELQARFTNQGAEKPGTWKVEVLEGDTVIGSSELAFVDGRTTAETNRMAFTYTPTGGAGPQSLTFDFGSDVTSFASGDFSTLGASGQDGFGPGTLNKVAFDATGTLVATYSNGQTRKGARLELGRFTTPDAVREVGGGLFAEAAGPAWQRGAPGEQGLASVRSGTLEISNVDLSREFSDLVVMQRGYQAASQVVSTANDMLQELFGMKHK